MQKGRVYRAAVPRITYNDMHWNHRAPARLQLDGFVVWNGSSLPMNTGSQAAVVWTPRFVQFRWHGTFTGASHTFNWALRQIPWPDGPGAEIRFQVGDGIGGSALKVWRWQMPEVSWGLVGFPEFSELTIEDYVGGFLPGHIFLQPTCVVYALEI